MTHDPMLDGITRWTAKPGSLSRTDTFDSGTTAEWVIRVEESVVLFSDLPALIARVREDEREKAYDSVPALAVYAQEKYEQGQRDEREACAAYIAARGLPITAAAIRAREEKP